MSNNISNEIPNEIKQISNNELEQYVQSKLDNILQTHFPPDLEHMIQRENALKENPNMTAEEYDQKYPIQKTLQMQQRENEQKCDEEYYKELLNLTDQELMDRFKPLNLNSDN